ncbi:hypothetical protein SCACP_08760 [Sporomusa carbonis]
MVLITLTYLYCVIGTGSYQPLGAGLKAVRANTQREKITMIYTAAKNGVPLEDVLSRFKVA